jgi:hypothetical protein
MAEVHADELSPKELYKIVDRFDDNAKPMFGQFSMLDEDNEESAIFVVDGVYKAVDTVNNKFVPSVHSTQLVPGQKYDVIDIEGVVKPARGEYVMREVSDGKSAAFKMYNDDLVYIPIRRAAFFHVMTGGKRKTKSKSKKSKRSKKSTKSKKSKRSTKSRKVHRR